MESVSKQSCQNCGAQLQGAYCHQCGQRQIKEKWSLPVLFKQFLNQITNIEKGFLYTIKALLFFPGKMILDYWQGKTIIYYNPFRYLLIWIAINLLISFGLGIDDMLQDNFQPTSLETSLGKERMETADQTFDSWMNLLVLLIIPIISAVTLLLFKKKGNNYAEHLIMNSFTFGQQSLFSSFTQIVIYFFPFLFPIYLGFNFLLGFAYNTYVFKQIFKEPLWVIMLKSLAVGIAGLIILFALIFIFSALAIAVS